MVRLDQVSKVYRHGQIQVHALRGVSLDVPRGEFLSVMGPSGSGKSTLLQLLGGLDTPTTGEIVIEGQRVSHMSDDEITLFRRRKIGVVFQFFNLLPTLTAEENVALPLLLDRKRLRAVRERVREVLDLVGLSHRADHKPSQLSGGEMQRVAVARALVTNPVLLLADEPTGSLDSRSGEEIMRLIKRANEIHGQTVLLVTHNAQAASCADRVITISDGRIVEERCNDTRPVAL
jgi:putative ABC transport system ATP-binding protein